MCGNLESFVGNFESLLKIEQQKRTRAYMIAVATLTLRAETHTDILSAPHTHATHVASTGFVQPSDLGDSAGEEGCRTGSVPDKKKISKVSALSTLAYVKAPKIKDL